MPPGVDGLVDPLHELVLVGLGMPILDNLGRDAISAEARRRTGMVGDSFSLVHRYGLEGERDARSTVRPEDPLRNHANQVVISGAERYGGRNRDC